MSNETNSPPQKLSKTQVQTKSVLSPAHHFRRGATRSTAIFTTGFDLKPTGSVPKYNLPRGANTGNVGATTHFGYQTVSSDDKAQKLLKFFIQLPANTTL